MRLSSSAEMQSQSGVHGSLCTGLPRPPQNNSRLPAAGLAMQGGLANGLGVHGDIQLPFQLSGRRKAHSSQHWLRHQSWSCTLTYPCKEQFKDTKRLNAAAVLPWMDCCFFSNGFQVVEFFFFFPECHAQQLKTNQIICNTCLTIP